MSESIEEVQARHRKEAKELQNKITQRKKQASKKTRKGVNDECTRLEEDLKAKQAAELAAITGHDVDDVPELESDDDSIDAEKKESDEEAINQATATLESTTISESAPADTDEQAQKGPKRNRQKERLARRAAEQEEAAKKAEAEALLQPNWKKQERTAMLATFAQHNLSEKDIRPDGHCLYSAIADQLTELGVDTGALNDVERSETFRYKPVRRAAALYILGHRAEFEPFMEEPVISYVSKIERTAEWGGHLELVALAKHYGVEVNVVQDGKTERIEPEGEGERKTIWLAYYQHGYGLGEHYNSLRQATGKVEGGTVDANDGVAP